MASVHKLGNSLAAVIPAQAARQLGLQFRTPILVYYSEDEIRIRNAGTPSARVARSASVNATHVVENDDPW
jgi:antitoxin component of MazEF toxin-antitoxin module